MIYFAQLTAGPIKIGYTGNVETRLAQLEQYYRQPIALLRTMEGDRSIEREIHARFASLRLARTEQFRPGPELMEFIGVPSLVTANPETVEVVLPVTLTTVVKMEAALIKKANFIAQDLGMPLSGYLSDLVREGVEQDWGQLARRLRDETDT